MNRVRPAAAPPAGTAASCATSAPPCAATRGKVAPLRTATLVPDPGGIAVEEIVADAVGVTLVLRTRRPTACCPRCDRPVPRVHSWYTRQLQDMP